MPLFEEFNRTRAFGVTLLRALAERGIGGMLPDWPGTSESLVDTRCARLGDIRAAHAALAALHPAFAVGIRSGALFDSNSDVRGRWHLSPVAGEELVRELRRVTDGAGSYAGNVVDDALMAELADAASQPARIVRLASDPRPAASKVDAAPLWRRAEPGNDPELADTLAHDIADWIDACDG